MSNAYYLAVIFFFFFGDYLMVTAHYLVVTGGYCPLLLLPTFNINAPLPPPPSCFLEVMFSKKGEALIFNFGDF